MQTTVLEQPALRLISAKAAKFPEGTKDAFAAIESRLSTMRGRRMYGLVFSTQDGLEYHAGLVPENESEERQFGFPIIEIPAGLCVRTKLLDWPEHTDQIGPLIGQMIAQFGIDPSRPTMEYYRSQRELHLLVPIPQRPNDNSRNAYALQRTAPRVTLAAPRRPAAQPARRAPQSLSLGSSRPLSHAMSREQSNQNRRVTWRTELLILSIALALSSCSTPTNQSAESTPAAALPSADLSNRAKIGNPAEYEVLDRKVTDQDLRILLKADELLGDESVWNRNDDRACDDDELNGKRSLFCALHKACVEVLGVYDHRRVALQEVRFAVEDVTRGRDFQHRLRDFNNLPETRFADIKAVLAVALKQVRERLNEAEK